MGTTIEWTDETWNVTRGCSLESPGCSSCYAMRQARRFSGEGGTYEGLTKLRTKGGPVWTGEVRFVPKMLELPLRWRKPRFVFVDSMSDLFHPSVSNEQIAAAFGVMSATPQHTYQLLTKRAGRLPKWFAWLEREARAHGYAREALCVRTASEQGVWDGVPWVTEEMRLRFARDAWPLPNLWLGVSVEDQQRADERIPELLRTPAATRFVSYEPPLGPVDFNPYVRRHSHCNDCMIALDWIICGAESGHGARPFNEDWARSVRDQCQAAGVAFFYKQNAVRGRKRSLPLLDGRQWTEMPKAARP